MLTSFEIRSAFAAPPAPVPVTLSYRLRLLGIVAGLSTLVGLYVALIALVALLAYYWALFGTIFAISGLTVFIWLAPLAAAVVIIVGLIRPLVRRRPEGPKLLSISANDEPILFEFLNRLSAMLNAPPPAAVCVHLDVNANAGFMGWKGLLTRKLQLTIGLPLAATFTLPQMAGVLAHELGHFSQGAGLRSYFLISKIREWLLRVAHERDSWDTWIQNHRRAGHWIVILVANVAWLGLMISRRYLAALARAAEWMTAAFSRHMEFDADRHEAAIVGATVFEETTLRMSQLRGAASLTWRDVQQGWAMRRAPEDVPGMIAALEQILTDDSAARLREEALAQRTGRWDTHPCDAERIEAACAFDAPSLFKIEGEARLLFADFSDLSRKATLHHYEKFANLDCDGVRFVTVENSVAGLQARGAGTAAVHSLFGCSPEFVADWLKLPARDPVAAECVDAEFTFDGSKEEAVYWAAAEKARLHFCARTIRDAGVKVNTVSFQLREDGVEAVRSEQAASAGELAVKMAALNRAASPAIATLERSVGFVWVHDPTYFVFESGWFYTSEVRDLWRLAGAFSVSFDDIRRMQWVISARAVVRANLRFFPLANGANVLDDLAAEAEKLVERVHSRIAGVVLEGGESSPTTAHIQGLVTRDRKSGMPALESFVRHVEAVRVWVLIRLTHFATAYGASRKQEQAQAAEAADVQR